MKKFLFIISTLLLLMSCSVRKQSVVTLPLDENLPQTDVYAPNFRMFWADFAKEVNKVNNINKFEPSRQLIEQYSLQKEETAYFLVGLITIVPDSFDVNEATSLGLQLTRMTNDTFTYSCNLCNLPTIVTLKGVRYIEVAQKVFNRL